jgi:hypothetical protein
MLNPPAKANINPATLATSVRKLRNRSISMPLRIHFISGIPDPAALGEMNSIAKMDSAAKKQLQIIQTIAAPAVEGINATNSVWA